MKSKDFDIEQLLINEIVINSAAIQNNTGTAHLGDDKYFFNVAFSFSPAVSKKHQKIKVVFTCNISASTIEEEPVDINGKFEIAYFFSIEDFERLVVIKSDDINLNPNLAASLANIVYSTSRGIIYTRLQGTIFKKIILPVMSTEKLADLLVYSENANSD